MRGVLLAGGVGNRLYPLTKVINKHLLPVGDRPMIYWVLDKFVECGIVDIAVVIGPEHVGQLVKQLGDGGEFGLRLTYKIQEQADGVAGALMLAEEFVTDCHDANVMVLLGDNIFLNSLKQIKKDFEKNACMFGIVGTKSNSPERFGVVELDENFNILSIEEKPNHPKSDIVQTGCYLYHHTVFDYMKDLDKSARGEFEITDLNNILLERAGLYCYSYDGFWSDAGTPESYRLVNEVVRR